MATEQAASRLHGPGDDTWRAEARARRKEESKRRTAARVNARRRERHLARLAREAATPMEITVPKEMPEWTVPVLTPEEEARFWSHVPDRGRPGCWPFARSDAKPARYPRFHVAGRSRCAHQAAWVVLSGLPIADWGVLVIRHLCANPACVRPDHMALGTFQENTIDRIFRDRMGGYLAALDTPTPLPRTPELFWYEIYYRKTLAALGIHGR